MKKFLHLSSKEAFEVRLNQALQENFGEDWRKTERSWKRHRKTRWK